MTSPPPDPFLARARLLARELLVVDAHIDLPHRLLRHPADVSRRLADGCFDAVRAREGGLDAAFAAVYVPAELGEGEAAFVHAERLVDRVEALVAEHPETFGLARSPGELRAVVASGRIALPLALENAAAIGHDLDRLRHLAERGIRYVTLAHGANNQLADSSYAAARRWGGLSPFGREAIAEMNRLGVMVDVSHLSDQAAAAAIDASAAPVIASHSSARRFTPGFERNLSDELVCAIAARGGVVMVNFGSAFLTAAANAATVRLWDAIRRWVEEGGDDAASPDATAFAARWRAEHPIPPGSVADLADHVDHLVALAGPDRVGLGSDYDGLEDFPVGLGDVSGYPLLFAELLRRGYGEAELRGIAGENLLRCWEGVAAAGDAGRVGRFA